MSISSIGAQSALIMQQLTQMRAQFDDLQRQLGTGQKSATYAGLGINRGVTVSLNAQLSAIGGYDNTIDNVMARINLMNTALGNELLESGLRTVAIQDVIECFDRRLVGGASGKQVTVAGLRIEQRQQLVER